MMASFAPRARRFRPRFLSSLSIAALVTVAAVGGCGGNEFKGNGGDGGDGGQGGSAGSTAGAAGSGTSGESGGAGDSGSGGSGISGAGGVVETDASAGSAGAVSVDGGGPAGAAGVSGAAGAAGAGGGGLTLENFCATTAEQVCGLKEPCCTAEFGYDAMKCKQSYLADCADDVTDVALGTKTFDPSHVPECYATLATLYQECRPTAVESFELFDGLRACNLVFQGMKTEGQNCAKDSDCLQSANPNVIATCGGLLQIFGLGTCRQATAVPQGGACQVGIGADISKICRPGLFCDISADVVAGAEPYDGTCEPATPLGSECALLGGYDIVCGMGAYCGLGVGGGDDAGTTSAVCTAAKPGGVPCTGGNQCESLVCEATTSMCAETEPVVTLRECKGLGG